MTTTPTLTEAAAEPVESVSVAKADARDYGLDVLRILAIAAVVAIHVFGSAIRHEPRHSTTWWIAVGIDLGSSWAVPA